ncbi:uncharacterized protein LOC134248695 isoform X2 [Saccostrea cucullata]
MSPGSQRRYQENLLGFSLLLYFLMVESSRNCPQSNMTFQYVKSCPRTREDWINAAARKNCSGVKQDCVKSEKFQYHCVINSQMNSIIEVCAPTWFCIGFCAEYNLQGERIQDNFNAPCKNFSNPCPPRYLSSEAYLYQECYKLVELQKKESFLQNKTYDVPSNDGETVLTVTIICYSAVLLSTFAVIIFNRKQEKSSEALRMDDEEIRDDVTMMPGKQNI